MNDEREPSQAFWTGTAVTVTGGAGFLGKPVVRLLQSLGAEVTVPRSAEFDLTEAAAADEALAGAEVVIHLAANVGGIGFNRRHPAPLVRDNMAMGLNIFEAARKLETKRLVSVCTVCAYPKFLDVPFREDDIWNGYPEETNAPYGLAKKMMVVLSDTYRRQYGLDSCVPILANLYGPDDNFDLEDSHVIPAMIHKYVDAQKREEDEVVLWGTGSPSREFLYVDDAARAVVLSAEYAEGSEPFNIGTGVETKIKDLSEIVSAAVGFDGATRWDTSRPDGQPVRYLDVTRATETIGFKSRVPLQEGIDITVKWFQDSIAKGDDTGE
ncbi:MAG TPA: NAD-dependent epimerase/dehydratase family protein [Solirubrobacterales bacterium]|nr:NAD-dependent epimerase/dehydratase family protein [Solirubrobacterales bacterium]